MTGMIGLIVSLVSVLVGGYLLGKARGFRKGLRKSEETPLDGIKGGPLYRQVHSLLEEQRAEIVKLRNEVHTDWRDRAEACERGWRREKGSHNETCQELADTIEELHNVNSALDAMNENLAARNDRCRYLESDRDALKQEVARLGKLVAEAREDGVGKGIVGGFTIKESPLVGKDEMHEMLLVNTSTLNDITTWPWSGTTGVHSKT